MRRKTNAIRILPLAPSDAALFLLCGCFLIGYLAAVLLLGRLGEAGADGLLLCLSALLNGGVDASIPSRPTLLWGILRWPLLLVLLRVTSAGVFAVPFLFCVRGFLLTFSVGLFASLLPGDGLLTAFILFGLSELLQLPAFFLLGTDSLLGAASQRQIEFGRQPREKRSLIDSVPFPRYGVCAVALLGAACLEYRVIPPLLSGLVAAGIF